MKTIQERVWTTAHIPKVKDQTQGQTSPPNTMGKTKTTSGQPESPTQPATNKNKEKK